MKEKIEYEEAKIDIICFGLTDIITVSGSDTGPSLGEETGNWESNTDGGGWTPF